jgi:hypothetical protein
MSKLILAGVVGIVAVILTVGPAVAGWEWCQSDPIVRLNGTEVQIVVAIPDTAVKLVTGPVDVKVNTPAGVTQTLVLTDPGFNGFGEQVTFGAHSGTVNPDGAFPVSIRVRVPIDSTRLAPGERVPVQVTITTSTGHSRVVAGNHTATGVDLLLVGTP